MPIDAPAPWAGGGWAPGVVVEFGPAREAATDDIAGRIVAQGGLGLIIDYGDAGRFTVGDTLQAVRRHKKVDPLAHPGQSDLTAHVALGAVAATADRAGATVWGPLPQGTFLERLGIHQRLERLARTANPEQLATLASGFDRLVATEQMGELFKVITVAGAEAPVPPGFTEAERWTS
jgi:NADH dehydrogenase [ubiquinone] 1 alpha subcomplex assembly factor 7